MPTFNDPPADAVEARQALRGLAHATRTIDDPRDIYPVLGSLSAAVASLEQSLHQLAAFHDGTTQKKAWAAGDDRARRAASHQVSWELHRAGDTLHQVAESLDHAHEVEATITYERPDFPILLPSARPSPSPGLSL